MSALTDERLRALADDIHFARAAFGPRELEDTAAALDELIARRELCRKLLAALQACYANFDSLDRELSVGQQTKAAINRAVQP